MQLAADAVSGVLMSKPNIALVTGVASEGSSSEEASEAKASD